MIINFLIVLKSLSFSFMSHKFAAKIDKYSELATAVSLSAVTPLVLLCVLATDRLTRGLRIFAKNYKPVER